MQPERKKIHAWERNDKPLLIKLCLVKDYNAANTFLKQTFEKPIDEKRI